MKCPIVGDIFCLNVYSDSLILACQKLPSPNVIWSRSAQPAMECHSGMITLYIVVRDNLISKKDNMCPYTVKALSPGMVV